MTEIINEAGEAVEQKPFDIYACFPSVPLADLEAEQRTRLYCPMLGCTGTVLEK